MTKILVLASASPRRQELLREAGIAIEPRPSHIVEERRRGEPPIEYASRLAREKAEAVARKFPDRYVLAADTIVLVNGQLLEKPRDGADARRMLRALSGREHSVTTAVSLVQPGAKAQPEAKIQPKAKAQPEAEAEAEGKTVTRFATTRVVFREISDKEIEEYIATGEPMDKAGAYAIQGGAGRWVERIEGEYSNVVGLPMSLLQEMLKEVGFL